MYENSLRLLRSFREADRHMLTIRTFCCQTENNGWALELGEPTGFGQNLDLITIRVGGKEELSEDLTLVLQALDVRHLAAG